MKLVNLSICLVLVAVFSGCFNGTNSPNSVAQEQEALQTQDLELLQNLQSIDLSKAFDSKGALSKYGKAEFNELKKISNDKPIILFVDKIEPKVMQNLQNGFREFNSKQEFFVYGVADGVTERVSALGSIDIDELKNSIRDRRSWRELCLKNNSIFHCRRSSFDPSKILVVKQPALSESREKTHRVMAEANKTMKAVYDANMTVLEANKALMQRKD